MSYAFLFPKVWICLLFYIVSSYLSNRGARRRFSASINTTDIVRSIDKSTDRSSHGMPTCSATIYYYFIYILSVSLLQPSPDVGLNLKELCKYFSGTDSTGIYSLSFMNCRHIVFPPLFHTSAKVNSAFHPCGLGKWVPASAGKVKAGMVHSVGE